MAGSYRTRVAWCCAVVVSLVAVYAVLKQPSKSYQCSDCNVILVSLDTLRADHLGCYGYSALTSPVIDGFSKEAALFETAIAQAPATTASHGSILTSLVPSRHGAFYGRNTAISKEVPTMAELLRAQGYKTASFNGGGQLGEEFGFSRGFDLYKSTRGDEKDNDLFTDRVRESIDWIESNKSGKFFLFLHSYDVHTPYAPDQDDLKFFAPDYRGPLTLPITPVVLFEKSNRKSPPQPADGNFIVGAYDGEIRGADADFKKLLDYLRSAGLFDKTMVIFTSDHGEEFGERHWWGWHSHTLYDEILRVPLIIKFPRRAFAGVRIADQVRSIDILPTVLDVLGIKRMPHFQGHTLLNLLTGGSSPDDFRYAFSQRDSNSRQTPTSVRTREWKLVGNRLFNLERDPGEKINVAGEFPKEYAELQDQRAALMKMQPVEREEAGEMEKEAIDQLRSLGYLK